MKAAVVKRYVSTLEGYVGANWSINVAKQALGIGLNKGLEGDFNGIKAVTREEACLYAFRTIQADLVEYGQRLTTNINGTEVTLSSGGAESRKWNSQQTRVNNIREDNIVQFAEEYFRKLEKKHDWDDFMRPAYTWIYDREEIGTYVDWEVMVAEYSKGVSGRDVYDLLGSSIINDSDITFAYYVDGVTWNSAPSQATKDGESDIARYTDLVRSNTKNLGISDNGVLTQVFLDKDRAELTIVSINTWLGQASGDYQESKEYAPVNVYYDYSKKPYTARTTNFNIDVEYVPGVVDVKDGDWLLLNITYKHSVGGDVAVIATPEVLEESVVTKFSTSDKRVVSKLTTNGTEYKNAMRAYYDDEALEEYDATLLTNKTYNIFLDPYGYVIGVALYEGNRDYVFITGFNRPKSNISIGTTTAAGIFLDGTMKTITVDLKATNDAIESARTKAQDGWEYFVRWDDAGLSDNAAGIGDDGCYRLNRWYSYSVDKDGVYSLTPAVRMVATRYNSSDGVSVETASTVSNEQYSGDTTVYEQFATVKTGSLSLKDNLIDANQYPYFPGATSDPVSGTTTSVLKSKYQNGVPPYTYGERAYGNDNSVYLTVTLGDVDTSKSNLFAITDVSGVYTGAQNVEIEIAVNDEDVARSQEAQFYAVYDKKGFIIGAVTTGKVSGDATIAYVLSDAKSERIEDGTYYWEFDAVLDGTVQTLTMKSKFKTMQGVLTNEATGKRGHANPVNLGSDWKDITAKTTSDPNKYDGLVELRMDADGYVVAIKDVVEEDIFSLFDDSRTFWGSSDQNKTSKDLSKYDAYRMNVLSDDYVDVTNNEFYNGTNDTRHYDSAPDTLVVSGRTLYITAGHEDGGLALTTDAKAVTIQMENKSWKTTEFTNVASAVSHLADAKPTKDGFQFDGEIIAALNSAGAAKWVVFINHTELRTGLNNGSNGDVFFTAMGYSSPIITFTLNNMNGTSDYTVTLERNTIYGNNNTWETMDTFTVDKADDGVVQNWTIGSLNQTLWQYRLRCGKVIGYYYF